MAFLRLPINTAASLETKNFTTESVALIFVSWDVYFGVKICFQYHLKMNLNGWSSERGVECRGVLLLQLQH
jgi:hypothetical protein